MSSSYDVKLVEHDFIQKRWGEIESLIKDSFAKSNFNDGYTVARPLQYTWDNIHTPYKKGLKHVLAINKDDKIIGACFLVPTEKDPGETECDIGWFFLSSTLSFTRKIRVADSMSVMIHETVRQAGFARIVTNMGTQEGARFTQKRYGYEFKPTPEQENRWVKYLQQPSVEQPIAQLALANSHSS